MCPSLNIAGVYFTIASSKKSLNFNLLVKQKIIMTTGCTTSNIIHNSKS